MNRHIKAADYATFQVMPAAMEPSGFARDKNHLYFGDEIVTAEVFETARAAGKV